MGIIIFFIKKEDTISTASKFSFQAIWVKKKKKNVWSLMALSPEKKSVKKILEKNSVILAVFRCFFWVNYIF